MRTKYIPGIYFATDASIWTKYITGMKNRCMRFTKISEYAFKKIFLSTFWKINYIRLFVQKPIKLVWSCRARNGQKTLECKGLTLKRISKTVSNPEISNWVSILSQELTRFFGALQKKLSRCLHCSCSK